MAEERPIDITLLLMIVGILIIGGTVGFAMTTVNVVYIFMAAMGLMMFVVSFVWPPVALYLLVFSMLLSLHGPEKISYKQFLIFSRSRLVVSII